MSHPLEFPIAEQSESGLQSEDFLHALHDDLPGKLRVFPGGWSYGRDDRRYLLWWPEVDSRAGDLELHVGGRTYWRRMDPRVAWCRSELAREVASDNAALRVEIRRDLFLASFKIRFAQIDYEMGRGPDDPAQQTVDLFITGLEDHKAHWLTVEALRAGARVRRRRHS